MATTPRIPARSGNISCGPQREPAIDKAYFELTSDGSGVIRYVHGFTSLRMRTGIGGCDGRWAVSGTLVAVGGTVGGIDVPSVCAGAAIGVVAETAVGSAGGFVEVAGG